MNINRFLTIWVWSASSVCDLSEANIIDPFLFEIFMYTFLSISLWRQEWNVNMKNLTCHFWHVENYTFVQKSIWYSAFLAVLHWENVGYNKKKSPWQSPAQNGGIGNIVYICAMKNNKISQCSKLSGYLCFYFHYVNHLECRIQSEN